ncbi:flippase [Shewanella algicola]|uniref:flippase n=1 Tax=Shewanella algicola TaxID=640633 RepID=UPI0024956988|nr:flippase [Shewanella algicola]
MSNWLLKIRSNSVARNSAALFALQLVNMIAPLVVLPYLARVLGVEAFGLVMLSFSASAIAYIVTDFGFNLSATYEISKRRDDRAYVNELLGAILLIKLGLCLLLFLCIFMYSYFIGFGTGGLTLPIYISLNVLVQAFLPTWFFQGIEKMKNVTICIVLAKISYVFLVFLFINSKSDVNEVILFYAVSNLVAVSVAISAIYYNGYAIKAPRTVKITDVFKDSSQFFLSRAAVSIYTSASTFLVGAFAGVQQAAIYGASEKIYQASQSITAPIAQALFPYMAKSKNNKLIKKVVVYIGVPLFSGCILVGLWANEIMGLIFGDEFLLSGGILQVFLVVTVINFVGVNFGYPAFAGIDKVHIANYTVILGAIVQAVCLFLLFMTDSFSAFSVVSSVLITELVIMITRIVIYNKYV